MTAKTKQNQTPLIAEKWANLTKPTGKKWKNQSGWQRTCTTGRNVARLAGDTGRAVTGGWQRTCTTGRNVARLAGDTGRAVTGNRLARYIKNKSQDRKDTKAAAKAEKERRQANRAAILEAHNNGGFVESDANGNIKYVGQRRAKVKTHQRTLASGETITVAANGMTKGEARSTGKPTRPRRAPQNKPKSSQPSRATQRRQAIKKQQAEFAEMKRKQRVREQMPARIPLADGTSVDNMLNPDVVVDNGMFGGRTPNGWQQDGPTGYRSAERKTVAATKPSGMAWSNDELEEMHKSGFDVSKARKATINQWADDDGKYHAEMDLMKRGIWIVLALLMMLPTAARAQAEPCLLTGGEPPITVAASPQMNLADYHMLKSAMGHDDLMEHEFLKVLRGYCPNKLRGVDKIDISLDHLPTVVILHESTAAAQRAAFATAQAETGAYTVYSDKPESGIGILYHANGWRMDTNGDWRSPTGGYAPTDPRHDPFQNMPDCWHTSSCNGPAPTASQTRGALLAVRDYAVEVATGPTVIEGSGPAPTPEPLVTNEFIEEPAGGFFGRVRWFASFCGTIVLIVILVGLIALGVMAAGRLREQKREAEAEAGKYGLGVMAAQPRGVSS